MRHIETIEQFCVRHGGEGIRVGSGLLFVDGAILPDSGDPIEPPDSPVELVRLKYEFVRAKLFREEQQFNSLQEYIQTQTDFHNRGSGPPPSDEAISNLHVLKPIVEALRRKFRELEGQLAERPENQRPRLMTLHEFSTQQKGEPLYVRDRYLFANGAQSDGHRHYGPPTNEVARLNLQIEFVRTKLERTVAQYNRDRLAISQQAHVHSMSAGPPPQPGWEEHLAELVEKIEILQKRGRVLMGKLPASPEHLQQQRRNEDQQRAAAIGSTLEQFPTF